MLRCVLGGRKQSGNRLASVTGIRTRLKSYQRKIYIFIKQINHKITMKKKQKKLENMKNTREFRTKRQEQKFYQNTSFPLNLCENGGTQRKAGKTGWVEGNLRQQNPLLEKFIGKKFCLEPVCNTLETIPARPPICLIFTQPQVKMQVIHATDTTVAIVALSCSLAKLFVNCRHILIIGFVEVDLLQGDTKT